MNADPWLLALSYLALVVLGLVLYLRERTSNRREEMLLKILERLHNRLHAKDLSGYMALEESEHQRKTRAKGEPGARTQNREEPLSRLDFPSVSPTGEF